MATDEQLLSPLSSSGGACYSDSTNTSHSVLCGTKARTKLQRRTKEESMQTAPPDRSARKPTLPPLLPVDPQAEKRPKKRKLKDASSSLDGTPAASRDSPCSVTTPSTTTASSVTVLSSPAVSAQLLEERKEDLGSLDRFSLSTPSKRSLTDRGIHSLFPIQYLTFDPISQGQDVIGRARTGTGKTLSFVLPVIERLFCTQGGSADSKRRPTEGVAVLCLCPTRELAQQVNREFELLSVNRYKCACLYGGTSDYQQISLLRSGVDVAVGTPGRTLDLLRRDLLKTKYVAVFILDEADQMLEMGFREDIDAILEFVAPKQKTKSKDLKSLPHTASNNSAASHLDTSKVQCLLFTATLPSWVQRIADKFMGKDRVTIDVAKSDSLRQAAQQQSATSGQASLSSSLEDSVQDGRSHVEHLVIFCGFTDRLKTLADVVRLYGKKCIIFTETKAQANDVAANSPMASECRALHGDVPQAQRELTLQAFKQANFTCLVATDVAARGIHIDDVDLVVQIDPPKDVDTYIHRTGRTGRANKSGRCLMYCKYSDRPFLRSIEQKAGVQLMRVGPPQPEMIAQKLGLSALESLRKLTVGKDALAAFAEAAKNLIDSEGAQVALEKCLYQISGCKRLSLSPRSLLSCREGYRTFSLVFKSTKLERHAYAWRALKEIIRDDSLVEQISGMTFLADYSGVVFDVPQKAVDSFCKHTNGLTWKSEPCDLSMPSSLPFLAAAEDAHAVDGQVERNPNHRWSRKRDGDNSGMAMPSRSSRGGRGSGFARGRGARGGLSGSERRGADEQYGAATEARNALPRDRGRGAVSRGRGGGGSRQETASRKNDFFGRSSFEPNRSQQRHGRFAGGSFGGGSAKRQKTN